MNRPIAIIVCLTAAIILAIALVFPKKGDLDSLNKKVSDKKSELRSKEDYFSNLEKTSNALEKYPTQLAKIGSALPQISQLPALFDFLQKAASQTGMVLTSITPAFLAEKSLGAEELNSSTVTLIVLGDYPAFRDFLRLLENSSRIIEAENISFSTQEGFPKFDLKIKTYSY